MDPSRREQSINVVVRLRPLNAKEQADGARPPSQRFSLFPAPPSALRGALRARLLTRGAARRRHAAGRHVEHAEPRGDDHPRHGQGAGPLDVQVRRRLRLVCHAGRGVPGRAGRRSVGARRRDEGLREHGVRLRSDRHRQDPHDGGRPHQQRRDGGAPPAPRTSRSPVAALLLAHTACARRSSRAPR